MEEEAGQRKMHTSALPRAMGLFSCLVFSRCFAQVIYIERIELSPLRRRNCEVFDALHVTRGVYMCSSVRCT